MTCSHAIYLQLPTPNQPLFNPRHLPPIIRSPSRTLRLIKHGHHRLEFLLLLRIRLFFLHTRIPHRLFAMRRQSIATLVQHNLAHRNVRDLPLVLVYLVGNDAAAVGTDGFLLDDDGVLSSG